MNGLKSIPNWILWTAALLAAALVFRFAMRGYAYIGYTLAFIAALIVLHHYLPRGAWRAVTALVCVGLIYFCIVEIPIIANSRTDKDPERKYLVVLGAAVHGSTPSLSMAHRLEGALGYLEAYPDSIAIVSGGQGNGEDISEAQAMYDWLTAHGVAPERVIMENRSTSTMENLEFSYRIIRERGDEPEGNVAIVSSGYHLYRAKEMSKMLGVAAAGIAGAPDYPLITLNFFIREAFGVTHLWVLGN